MYPQARKSVVNLRKCCGYSSVSDVIYTNEPKVKELISAKPFEQIPGPRSLPIIGTLHQYLPFIGKYSFSNLYETGVKKLKEFGPIVKEEIVPGNPTVWVFKPEDVAKIFQADTKNHPHRRSHLALYKYRKDRSDVYSSGGLLPTNGAEWYRIRKEFQKDLSKPQIVVSHLESIDQIIQNFVSHCQRRTDYDDFLPLLSRLFLEITSLVSFDARMNCFSEEEMKNDSVSSKLIHAALTTNSVMLKLDNGPQLWRFFDTPLYSKLVKAQNYMEKIAIELVSKKKQELESNCNNNDNSVLKKYLQNPALSEKDIVGMTCDMLLAGIDTTSYVSAYTLYHLANNLECQESLYKESKSLWADKSDPITSDTLRKASYTKAVLKESLRLNPLSIGIGRVLQEDVILSGYHVPKGVNVVTQNQVVCRSPEYFKNSESFLPERWLRDNDQNEKTNPFLMIPFGHGPRTCIAKRFAEQNLQTFLLRMCQNFRLTWKGGPIKTKTLLINVPAMPMKLHLERRNEV